MFEQLFKKMEKCYWNIEDRTIWPEEGETVREAARASWPTWRGT
jgi:hypothetical protein